MLDVRCQMFNVVAVVVFLVVSFIIYLVVHLVRVVVMMDTYKWLSVVNSDVRLKYYCSNIFIRSTFIFCGRLPLSRRCARPPSSRVRAPRRCRAAPRTAPRARRSCRRPGSSCSWDPVTGNTPARVWASQPSPRR